MKTQHIVHTIGGGWATDYGPTYYNGADNGHLVLPWLTQAENLLYTLEGGVKKWPGTDIASSRPMIDHVAGTTHVKAVTDYWRQSSSQKIVASVGSSYFDITNINPILIGSTLSGVGYAKPHNSVFNDLLIMATQGIAPRSWDQSTYQFLAGTPPNFAFSTPHRGRHWAAGNSSAPSRLYYSVVGSPEDWVGSGSGSIDIDPGDGDKIVGIISWKKELFVFKGPNRLSIHRITGAAPDDFARDNFIVGISAASQHAIFEYGNDIGFWSPRGSCHSLTATDTYGDYAQAFINYPILNWCRNLSNISTNGAEFWQAATHPTEGYTVFNYTSRGAIFGVNNETILMDWRFINQGEAYPRFSRLTYTPFSCVGMVQTSGQTIPYWGDAMGTVYSTATEPVPHRGGGAFRHIMVDTTSKRIPFRCQTPYLTYGPDLETKTISNFSLTCSTAHRSTVTVKWGGSKQPKQTITVAQPGYVPLGTFVLGRDCLGELGTQPVFCQDLSGDFRSIQYNIIEDSALGSVTTNDGAGIQFTAFGASITPTGDSTEN